jgi:REP element-mobilizing transposase RayT
MGRKARIDAVGAVHHVVARGIERGRIFRDHADHAEFVKRLGGVLADTGGSCCAWALMPNHIHLVLRTGKEPLSRTMHRLLLGYCIYYNLKYGRKGHLFEGRYKSILCEEEPYLLELVRYVHLNPVRAGICGNVAGLGRYQWSGHRYLMGHGDLPWMEADVVLSRFARGRGEARRKYSEFLSAGLENTTDGAVDGESLRHLVEGGWETVKEVLGSGAAKTNESIMGSDRFIEKVLKEASDEERWKSRIRRRVGVDDVLARAAREAGLPVGKIKGSGKVPAQCRGRALACYWLVDVLGMTEVAVARTMGIT